MASLDQLIDLNSATINSTLATARSLAGRISNVYPGNVGNQSLSFSFNKPAMEKPQSFGDLLPSDTSGSTIRFLNGETEAWLQKYFPNLQSAVGDAPERWIGKILNGGEPFADSQAIFETIWHQARDQAGRERESATRQIRAEFTGRGFQLPPGAMVGAMIELDQRTADAVAEVNRAEMIRVSEIKLNLVQFAVREAASLKLGIMQLLASFYQQWISLPQRDIEMARAKVAAYASLQSSLSSYYNVELGFEELRLRAAQAKLGGALQSDQNKIAAAGNNQAAPALGNAVRAFGDVATGAATSQAALIADLNAGG